MGITAGFPIRLDRRVSLTGTHSAGTTTWTLPFSDSTLTIGVKADGTILTLTRPTATTATYPGNLSAAPIVIGRAYSMDFSLTRQYIRTQNGQAMLRSGLRVNRLTVQHRRAGDYEFRMTRATGGDITRQYNPTTIIDGEGEFSVSHLGDPKDNTFYFSSNGARPVTLVALHFECVASLRSL